MDSGTGCATRRSTPPPGNGTPSPRPTCGSACTTSNTHLHQRARQEQLDGETPGQWYLRQLQGSANIDGGPLLHLMTGNLSHQIEHHLFPDLPSNRYAQIAPWVRALCDRYGLRYNTGPLIRQTASVWNRILRLAVPGPTRADPGHAHPGQPDTGRPATATPAAPKIASMPVAA